jgi:hypothetical protein
MLFVKYTINIILFTTSTTLPTHKPTYYLPLKDDCQLQAVQRQSHHLLPRGRHPAGSSVGVCFKKTRGNFSLFQNMMFLFFSMRSFNCEYVAAAAGLFSLINHFPRLIFAFCCLLKVFVDRLFSGGRSAARTQSSAISSE